MKTEFLTKQHAVSKNPNVLGRYSNSGVSDLFVELPGSDDKTDLPSDYYSNTNTGSSSSFDWGKLIGNGLDSVSTLLGKIFGKEDTYRANAYSQLYEQEKRSNTILWIVIGLILALGVVLVIRKTK